MCEHEQPSIASPKCSTDGDVSIARSARRSFPSSFSSLSGVPLSLQTGMSPLTISIASLVDHISSVPPHSSHAASHDSPMTLYESRWRSRWPGQRTMRLNPAIRERARVVARHLTLAPTPGDSRRRRFLIFLDPIRMTMSL